MIEIHPVELHKVCKRCGRKLKNPEYMERGYGKICWEKIQKSKRQKKLFTFG